jgi:hypothetical protein
MLRFQAAVFSLPHALLWWFVAHRDVEGFKVVSSGLSFANATETRSSYRRWKKDAFVGRDITHGFQD